MHLKDLKQQALNNTTFRTVLANGKWYCNYLANDYIIISEMYEKVPYLVMEYGSCGTFRRRKD